MGPSLSAAPQGNSMHWINENFQGFNLKFCGENLMRNIFRSRSVPRPPFTLFTPPSSSESNKRGEWRHQPPPSPSMLHVAVPMNKIVLKAKPSRPNLKNIKPKVNTLDNTNHKVIWVLSITTQLFMYLQTAWWQLLVNTTWCWNISSNYNSFHNKWNSQSTFQMLVLPRNSTAAMTMQFTTEIKFLQQSMITRNFNGKILEKSFMIFDFFLAWRRSGKDRDQKTGVEGRH